MEVTLPLDKMTLEEKIQAMESIWDDLCKKADSIPSPAWHEKVLHDREKRIKNGEEEFEDWNRARKNIEKMGSHLRI